MPVDPNLSNASEPAPAGAKSEEKEWPLSWVLIAILTYLALQVGYFLFFAG